MNGRFMCLSGLVFPPSKEIFQFRKQRNHMGQCLGNTGGEAKQLLFLSSKRCNYCLGMSRDIVM